MARRVKADHTPGCTNMALRFVDRVALVASALVLASTRCVRADAPILVLNVGNADTVVSVATFGASILGPGPSGSKPPPCPSRSGTSVLVPMMRDARGNAFCIVASLDGLGIVLRAPRTFNFVTPADVGCIRLSGKKALLDVSVSVGRFRPGMGMLYDRPRAECRVDQAYLYALSVEKQNDADFRAVKPSGGGSTWTLTIPWNTFHIGHDSTALAISVNGIYLSISMCVNPAVLARGAEPRCGNTFTAGSLASDFAPFTRLDSSPGATVGAGRLHDVEFNATYNYGSHNLVAVSLAQNQSNVAIQRSLTQALSISPVSLPASQTAVVIGQDLQTLSAPLFAFQQPSALLSDAPLKPLFDMLPFSITKVGSLAGGYSYGYSSETVTSGLFYGVQGPRVSSGAVALTLAVATAPPKPTPTPIPTPTSTPTPPGVPTAATPHKALQPLAPPAPLFESAYETERPFQMTVLSGFTNSLGVHDGIDAIAVAGHIFHSEAQAETEYSALSVTVFGRLEHDFRLPILASTPYSVSQFVGESATFTSARAVDSGPLYFQVRESVGVQLDDRYFAPVSGTTSWVSPLSGPVGHITISTAAGNRADYFALDLFGYRLRNINGDSAAQEGWQASLPIPRSDSGWLLSGGSETQTVSDRIAAIEQGLLSSYAQTLVQVLPVATIADPVPASTARPQRLGNVRLDSPNLNIVFGAHRNPNLAADDAKSPRPQPAPSPLQLKFTAGFDFGTVSACQATPASSAKRATIQCALVTDNRAVGGVFLQTGSLQVGATDTSVASNSVATSPLHNASGGSQPGGTTAYFTYKGCPQISAAYANAAFPTGVPFPQQGSTFSGQLSVPIYVGALEPDLIFGYFNERSTASPAFSESAVSIVVRIGTTFKVPEKKAPCNHSN